MYRFEGKAKTGTASCFLLVADHLLQDHAELKVGIQIDSGEDVVEGVVGVEGGRFLVVRDQRRTDDGGGGGNLRLDGGGHLSEVGGRQHQVFASAGRGGLGSSGGGGSVGIVEHVHVDVKDVVQDVEEVVRGGVPLRVLGGYDRLLLADEVADNDGRLGGSGDRAGGRIVEAGHGVEVWFGVGVRCGPGAVALDLGPLDVLGEEGTALEKELAVVRAGIRAAGDTLESVQIQLPLEAGELALIEVLGHDVVGELLRLVDEEGPSVGLPADDVGEALRLDAAEHVVQTDWEGRFDSASGDVRNDTGRIGGVIMVGVDDAAAPVLFSVVVVGSLGRGTSGDCDHRRGNSLRCRKFCGLCS